MAILRPCSQFSSKPKSRLMSLFCLQWFIVKNVAETLTKYHELTSFKTSWVFIAKIIFSICRWNSWRILVAAIYLHHNSWSSHERFYESGGSVDKLTSAISGRRAMEIWRRVINARAFPASRAAQGFYDPLSLSLVDTRTGLDDVDVARRAIDWNWKRFDGLCGVVFEFV